MGAAPAPGAAAGAGATPAIVVVQRQGPPRRSAAAAASPASRIRCAATLTRRARGRSRGPARAPSPSVPSDLAHVRPPPRAVQRVAALVADSSLRGGTAAFGGMPRWHARGEPDPSTGHSAAVPPSRRCGATPSAASTSPARGRRRPARSPARPTRRSTADRSRRRRWCSRCGSSSPARAPAAARARPRRRRAQGWEALTVGEERNEYDAAMVFNVTQGGDPAPPPWTDSCTIEVVGIVDDPYNQMWLSALRGSSPHGRSDGARAKDERTCPGQPPPSAVFRIR